MDITLSMTIRDGDEPFIQQDIIHLSKSFHPDELIGLSLAESKQLLKTLQQQIVELQARQFIQSQKRCPCCEKKRRLKEYRNLYYRTVFGIVNLNSPRLYYCACEKRHRQSFSVLSQWLPEHVSPELQVLEAKWASLMSYNQTAERLKEVLPIGDTLNAATIRNHLTKVAHRQEAELDSKEGHITGCPKYGPSCLNRVNRSCWVSMVGI